jgi:RHS repeat-associated protein
MDDGTQPGGTNRRYTYNPQVYGELISQDGPAFHHYDALGSTRNLTDGSQSVTDTRDYKAFGSTNAGSGSSPNRFWWIGRLGYYAQPDTGDHWVRARVLASRNGRWISRDRAVGRRRWNPYCYCGSSPANCVDRSGLAPDGADICDVKCGDEPGEPIKYRAYGPTSALPKCDPCKESEGIMGRLTGIGITLLDVIITGSTAGYADTSAPRSICQGGNPYYCSYGAYQGKALIPDTFNGHCQLKCVVRHELAHASGFGASPDPVTAECWAFMAEATCLFDLLDSMRDSCGAEYCRLGKRIAAAHKAWHKLGKLCQNAMST